jgi:hypothetical protein
VSAPKPVQLAAPTRADDVGAPDAITTGIELSNAPKIRNQERGSDFIVTITLPRRGPYAQAVFAVVRPARRDWGRFRRRDHAGVVFLA